MAIAEKVLGPEHPSTAASLNNLAGPPSPDHPGAALGLNKLLGQIYARQGKYAQAEPLYQRALAIYEKTLGPQHPDVADVLEDYARLLRETGRNEEGQQMEQRATEIRARAPQE